MPYGKRYKKRQRRSSRRSKRRYTRKASSRRVYRKSRIYRTRRYRKSRFSRYRGARRRTRMFGRLLSRNYVSGARGWSSSKLSRSIVRMPFNIPLNTGLSGDKFLLWQGNRAQRFRLDGTTLSQIINYDSDLSQAFVRFRRMRCRKLVITIEFMGSERSPADYVHANNVAPTSFVSGLRQLNMDQASTYNPQNGTFTSQTQFVPPVDMNDMLRNVWVYTVNDSRLLSLHRKGTATDQIPPLLLSTDYDDIVQEGSRAIRMKPLLGTKAISRNLCFYQYEVDTATLGTGATLRFSTRPAKRIGWIVTADDLTALQQSIFGVHYGFCTRTGVRLPADIGLAIVVPVRVYLTGVMEFADWSTNVS